MPAYGPALVDAINDVLTSGTIKAMLVDSAYTFNPDATTAPTGNEISGSGYSAGGITITSSIAAAWNTTDNRVQVTVTGTINFGAVVATGIGGLVIYIVGGKPILADLWTPIDADGSTNLVYTPDPDGVMWAVV